MSVKYRIGELIDVFDPKDEIFCPASIVGVTYNKNYVGDIVSVRIHYLGSYILHSMFFSTETEWRNCIVLQCLILILNN